MDPILTLQQMLESAKRPVFFGGAGVSTESGVPDFRSADGIYQQEVGAETILTPAYMDRNPVDFWRFYRQYFMPEGIKPNACHLALAALEKRGKMQAVITQNVDGLHQAAGSLNVIELHGNGRRFYCERCGKPASFEAVKQCLEPPTCACGGRVRPDIVLYNESLDTTALEAALAAITATDLLIIGGTSMTVYPAAGLVRYQQAGHLVIINRDKTGREGKADLVINDAIALVFEKIAAGLGLF